ncbi:MAG: OmpA family protein [Candidatus Kapabacteria bacterium]|nr:OmpA family protein [Candidatus Kapabacteria bacterium]MDW8224964.1 OmpA family protein [Bacteroidota bacterium]
MYLVTVALLSFLETACLWAHGSDYHVKASVQPVTVIPPASGGKGFFLYAATIEPLAQPLQEQETILGSRYIRIINLGPVVNSSNADYAPTVTADGRTLYFVSNRPGSKLLPDKNYSHDFWAARKENPLDTIFLPPFNIDTTTVLGDLGVNTRFNEGVATIAADGRSLFFTGCNRPDGLGSCDIYVTEIEGDRWARPRNLGPNVNSPFWDAQPSIAPDKSRIYFVSNRPGPHGEGNLDIWYSDFDFEKGEWRPAVNLHQLNTAGREASPFIAADNQTFFFASDGHKPNFGGLDFCITRRLPDGGWSTPQNLGKPINTPEDELFLTLPAAGNVLYFASKRRDLPGYQGDYDLFMAFVPTFFRAINIVGRVIDECTGADIPAKITIRNPIIGRVATDTVSGAGTARTEFQYVVSTTDFGDPKLGITEFDLEISAFNPNYGTVLQKVHVEKPPEVRTEEEAQKSLEIRVTLTLGQRPVLQAQMEAADYIKRRARTDPSIANFRGLVMEEVASIELFPLLHYVFFEEGSSQIPERYILFRSPEETRHFSDERIPGGTLEKYYHILNIYGYRLRKNPQAKLEIVGCNDNKTPAEKRPGLSQERAQAVFAYLRDIWGIASERMRITVRDLPRVPSNLNDPQGIVENRRVELICSDWEVVKPIISRDPKRLPSPETMNYLMRNGIEDALVESRRIEVSRGHQPWNTLTDIGTITPSYTWDWVNPRGEYPSDEVPYQARLIVRSRTGQECASDPITIPVMQVTTEQKKIERMADRTLERYNLILFPFDRYDAGPVNERILREYVFPRVFPNSTIEIVGHTDVVGLYDHNKKLSENRARTAMRAIESYARGRYQSLTSRGVGEDDPLYTNDLPEGRFYNRTVQILISTPIEAEPATP